MRGSFTIFRRELAAYFTTPLAYVFIVIFLGLAGAFTFYLGRLFERGQADLESFFLFHPWLYLILVPAIGMRLWAEERRSGTIELLLTLPVTPAAAVVGKFAAAWAFATIALSLTFPVWVTVNYLGRPDNGVILASYIGSWLMAGGFLALTACLSALTRNQVIAFILGAAVCFGFLMSGIDIVLGFFRGWAPAFVVELIGRMSFVTHFADVIKGVIALPTAIFFLSLIALCLFVNTQLVRLRQGG